VASSVRPERRKKSPSILYRRPCEELDPIVLSLFFCACMPNVDCLGGTFVDALRFKVGAAPSVNVDLPNSG